MQAFVAESDYMRLSEVEALHADLGVDEQVAQTIIDKGYRAQQIASQPMVNGTQDASYLAARSQ